MNVEQNAGAIAGPNWFKSSYSGAEGGDCVEVAKCPGAVRVRDSKDTARPGLTLAPTAWSAFVGFAAGERG